MLASEPVQPNAQITSGIQKESHCQLLLAMLIDTLSVARISSARKIFQHESFLEKPLRENGQPFPVVGHVGIEDQRTSQLRV